MGTEAKKMRKNKRERERDVHVKGKEEDSFLVFSLAAKSMIKSLLICARNHAIITTYACF